MFCFSNSMCEKMLKKIFEKLKFSKIASPESFKAAQDSMLNIINRFAMLDEKSKNLAEKYPEQKKIIHRCFENTKKIEPSVSVRAGKFEQALALQITKVSSAIDKILTNGDEQKFGKELELLERYVRVRTNADNGAGDE